MGRIKKIIFGFFIVIMLTIGTNTFADFAPYPVAEAAAIKVPSLKAEKKTLYTGYNTYAIEFKNVSSSAKITYKSSNIDVAKVTKAGIVSPNAKGSATITATVKQNSKTYILKLTVTVQEPKITFTQSTDYLNVGDTFVFKAKVEGMDAKVVWSVSDTSKAGISTAGILTPAAAGNVTIYAKAGGKTAKCSVTIGSNSLGTLSTNVTIFDTTTIWIHSLSEEKEESLTVDKASSDVASYTWGDWSGAYAPLTITPIGAGTESITITSDKTEDRLVINITVVDAPAKKELTSKEIYAKCVPCTVEISVSSDEGDALGSGFFIGDGKIVTNYHVIEGATKIVVTTSDNKQYEIKNILGYSATLDLAVLELDIEHDYLNLCQEVSGGEDIYTLGSPLGLTGTMTKGMVSTASRVIDEVEYIQIDASISNGNSGGPLVNVYGEVVGINTMYIEGGQNLNFAISIKELQKIYTSEPETVEEYHKRYEEYWEKWFYDNMIYEDASVSQDKTVCQTAYSGYGVSGTIKPSEYGDLYYFEVTEAGYLNGAIFSENITDLKNTYFSVYSYSGTHIDDAYVNEEDLYQYVNTYLDKGEYLIMIYLPDGYTGADVNYLFTLYYQ